METSSKSNPERDIPNAELEILACLWRFGKATARQIRETMLGSRPMAHGSVITLLKRLEAKGLVARERGLVGKAFLFKATKKPASTHRRLVRNLVRRAFDGDGMALVASLFETHPPTPEEVEELQRMLDELREKTKDSESKTPRRHSKRRN